MARVNDDFRIKPHHFVSEGVIHEASEVFLCDLSTLNCKIRSTDFSQEKSITGEDTVLSLSIQ